MKIAFVLDHFDPELGGLEKWTFQAASWLRDRGHEIHVVASSCVPSATGAGFVPHPLGPSSSRIEFAEKAEVFLRGLNVDIIHDLGSGWYFDVLHPHSGCRLAVRKQNLRSLPFFRRLKFRRYQTERKGLREAIQLETRQYSASGGRIIALSQMTRADLQHYHRVSSERFEVIYNGVDTDRYAPVADMEQRNGKRAEFGLPEGVVFLFAAHNFRLKGLDPLLKALARLRRYSVHLLVAGHGEIERYRKRAARLGLRDRVTFCGHVREMQNCYAAVDVLVHPTYYDPCSLVLLEAWSCGLPSITTRLSGASELLQTGVQGFVLSDPGNVRALAKTMRQLLDPGLRERMGAEARKLALTRTAGNSFERILATYRKVLETGRGRESLHRRGLCPPSENKMRKVP